MENRSYALMTGLFTIALIVAAVLAGMWLNRDSTERIPYMIATTQSIPGLNPQATVRYRGLEVGKVTDISFNPRDAGQIVISLAIDPETPVTRSTYATLGYQGVTGIAYIQLDDDDTGSPRLASSDKHIAVLPLRPGFFDQLEKRGKTILDQTDALTKRASDLLDPAHQKALMAAVDKIDKAADSFGQIPQKLAPTIDRMPALAEKADRSMAAFGQLSTHLDQLTTTLGAPNGPIERLTRTADRVGGSVEAITSDIELQTLPHIVSMADEAKTSLRAVKRTVNTINDRPQSLLFGAPAAAPGPGEPGFTPPNK